MAIWYSVIYDKESKTHLAGIYKLGAYKDYFKEENIWKLLLAIQHFKNLINFFYKKNTKKQIAISLSIYSALPITKPIIKLNK